MDVFLDPRLPDYFSEWDWREVKQRKHETSSPFGDFLNQRLSVVHGYNLGALDLNFLNNLSFPQKWEFKKLQIAKLLTSEGGQLGEFVFREGFSGDKGAYDHFLKQVEVLTKICNDLVSSIIPFAPQVVNMLTRFSETRMENLHFDLDGSSDDHEAFRLYINLDSAPRLWATSYQMTELIRQGGQRLVHGLDPTLPGERLLKSISTRAFGGWNQRATERLSPRHMIFVDPGDIFFIDGRSVSHQVVTGHRVFTVYARLPHAANPQMRPTFAEKIRSSLAGAANTPIGSETAIVNYYKPSQISAAPNVSEQWSEVFGQTSTGRIRRFDDNGLMADSKAAVA